MPHVRKRADGRYEARIRIRGKRISVYAADPVELGRRLAVLEQELHAGEQYPLARASVSDWLARWYETESGHWRPRTAANYQILLHRYVLPRFGHAAVTEVSAADWQQFLGELPRRTASQIYSLLRRAGNVAVERRWLPASPVTHVASPPYQPARRVLPGQGELVRLFQSCLASEDRGALLVAFVLLTGLRLGEVAALEWSDIDWEAGLVHVRRSGQWLPGRRWVVTPPKTPAGYRSIVLGPLGLTLLDKQKALLEREGLVTPLVFPRSGGLPIDPGYTSDVLRRLCARAGVPPLRFHDCRHASASLLLCMGVPLPEVSRRLGHSSPHITAAVYSHAVRGDQAATLAIERALGGEG